MSDESTPQDPLGLGPNRRRYAEMSVPFANGEGANEAGRAFLAAVLAARIKYRIADVYVIASISHETPDGDVVQGAMLTHWGDQSHAVPLLAQALGEEKQRSEERIKVLLADGKRFR